MWNEPAEGEEIVYVFSQDEDQIHGGHFPEFPGVVLPSGGFGDVFQDEYTIRVPDHLSATVIEDQKVVKLQDNVLPSNNVVAGQKDSVLGQFGKGSDSAEATNGEKSVSKPSSSQAAEGSAEKHSVQESGYKTEKDYREALKRKMHEQLDVFAVSRADKPPKKRPKKSHFNVQE